MSQGGWVRNLAGLGFTLYSLHSPPAWAQPLGISTQGATGGLVIPYAEVLSQGTLAFSYGNYEEPQLGPHSTQRNLSFGVGLLPQLELFGRFTNYVSPVPGSAMPNGLRDLSPNLKLKLPTPWASGPTLAVGLNDFSGGAVNFKSRYLVTSDQYGPLGVSLGYAQGIATQGRQPVFDGLFGGVAWQLADSGVTLLAEHDGQQNHAGLRWHSPPLPLLGRAQLVGSLQRSFGAVSPGGRDADASRFLLSLLVPLGGNEARMADAKLLVELALPALPGGDDVSPMQATPEDRMASLRQALAAVGLERVRVGLRDGLMGSLLMVEYENHRYGQNEADALGVALGLAAELAPRGTQRVHAVTFKDGLRLYETSVGVAVYRAFLRGGPASHVRDSLSWDRLPADQSDQTRWIEALPGALSRVRIEFKPDLNYTLGTEVGAFDYALAAKLQAVLPLWTGARVYSNYLLPVAHSSNMEDGAAFESSRQRRGLKTVALQQSLWLGKQVLASVAAGRFHYSTLGVQAEAALFVPGTDDVLRLRGAGYNRAPGALAGQDRAAAASYRRMLTPTMWLEAGVQRYSDASNGPSVEWTRWFGDVSVQLSYRKGGDRQFAGLQLSFPLTPRQGMAPAPIIVSGASQFSQGIRTRLTSASQAANLVQPGAVRDLTLETSLDTELLNAGRSSQSYFMGQLDRMREAFFMYGRARLN